MGSLGTVGALAVEEFLSKLKEAVQELSHAPVMPCGGDTFPLPPSVSGSVAGVDCRRAALGSDVPSAFGERSVVSSGGRLLQSLQRRNLVRTLKRSCEGF